MEAGDAANHLTVHRTALTAKHYLAPNVNSAESQKPSEVNESVKLHLQIQMWSAVPEGQRRWAGELAIKIPW